MAFQGIVGASFTLMASQGIVGAVIEQGEAIIVADAASDSSYMEV